LLAAAEQQAANRQAQARYREKKKAEQSQLQTALDQLTAQLAATKVLESQAAELRHTVQLQVCKGGHVPYVLPTKYG
jgi:hypothetical protein